MDVLSTDPIFLWGNNRLACSVAICLLKGGHSVIVKVNEQADADALYFLCLQEPIVSELLEQYPGRLETITCPCGPYKIALAIVVTDEDEMSKKRALEELEAVVPADVVIAVNTESIALSGLQQSVTFPQRVAGLNWVLPAQTTFFLEIIGNDVTEQRHLELLMRMGIGYWGKDPFVIRGDYGVRSKLILALLREAFFLVDKGYASVQDIDRACRNDAGYYLPFSGNLRYMDLMGTYAYGMVMKELNPELASDRDCPAFYEKLVQNGEVGMQYGQGFYNYQPGEYEKWETLVSSYSRDISVMMEKYPFNYKKSEEA